MKTLLLAIFAVTTYATLALADGDWALLNQAKHEAEQAHKTAEEVHQDHTHNCGGHAGKAAEYLEKARHELDEAEKYLAAHPHQKG